MEQKGNKSPTDGHKSMTVDENNTNDEISDIKQNESMSRKDGKVHTTGDENNSNSENNDLKQKRCTSPTVRQEEKYSIYDESIQNGRILPKNTEEVDNYKEGNITFCSTDGCQNEIKFQADRDVIKSDVDSNNANNKRCIAEKESCNDPVERTIMTSDSPVNTNDGPANKKDDPANTKHSPADTKHGPDNTKDGPANTKDGPAATKNVSANTKDSPAATKNGSANTKDSPADTKHGPANKNDGPANTKDSPADTRDGPTNTKDGSPDTKDGPANTKDSPADAIDGPTNTKCSPADTKNGPANTKDSPADTKYAPAYTKDSPADTKHGPDNTKDGPANTKDGSPHTKDGPANTKDSPADAIDGPANTKCSPADTKNGPANTKDSPADTKDGLANTKDSLADTKHGLDNTKDGPANTKDGPVDTKDGSADTKDSSADTKDGPADTKDSPADTKDGQANTKDSPADTNDSPADTKDSPANTKESPDDTKDSPANTKNGPGNTKDSPADTKDDLAYTKDSPADTKDGPADAKDSQADTKAKDKTEKIKDTVQSQIIIQLSMAQITLAIFGTLSASVVIQTIFYSVMRLEQGQLTSAGSYPYSYNDSVRAHYDFAIKHAMDQWKEIEIQNKTINDILSSSIVSVESIHDLTDRLSVLNKSIQNVFENMKFTEIYLVGVNKSYHNLTIQYSVLYENVSQIISSITSLNNKWDEMQFIVAELNGSISEDISQRNRSEKQMKIHMDLRTRGQQEILTTSLDFRHLVLLISGVIEVSVLLVFCARRFNNTIQQQRKSVRKVLGRCLSCRNGAICFLEISLHNEERRNDDCIYRALSSDVMAGMDKEYCHVSIKCREDLDSLLPHQIYLLFLEVTNRGGVLETSYDLSDFRRSVVKGLMARTKNVLIVATKHSESQQLPGDAILSQELKCIKGDDVLEELKRNNCLLSIKDTFSDLQKNYIRSVLLKD